MICFTSPEKESYADKKSARQPKIFLAGTIDMGHSPNWQLRMVKLLAKHKVTIFNPRRKEWNSSWKQSGKKIHPQLKEQILWELDYMDKADVVAVWLSPKSKSVISLMEIGLHARLGKLVIGCPHRYWRAANVHMTAQKYGAQIASSWNEFTKAIRYRIEEFQTK